MKEPTAACNTKPTLRLREELPGQDADRTAPGAQVAIIDSFKIRVKRVLRGKQVLVLA